MFLSCWHRKRVEPVPHDPFLERIEMHAQNSEPKPENFMQFSSGSIVQMFADYSMAELLIQIVHKRLDCTLRISSSRQPAGVCTNCCNFSFAISSELVKFFCVSVFVFLGSSEWKTIFYLIRQTIFILPVLSTVNCTRYRTQELLLASAHQPSDQKFEQPARGQDDSQGVHDGIRKSADDTWKHTAAALDKLWQSRTHRSGKFQWLQYILFADNWP